MKNFLLAILLAVGVSAQAAAPPAVAESNVVVYPFDMSQMHLTSSRWMDNQNRTIAYLKFLNLDRMLYNFRKNHGLSTQGAATNGNWDAPDFPFRSHFQGHLLSAWAQCWATTRDPVCKSNAITFVQVLQKCQANNAAVGFRTGYLSGFPESDFDALEAGNPVSVSYYVIHKIMAGLLDVWKNIDDGVSKTVLLALARWVDGRTAPLSYSTMQTVLNTEHGGMVEVLTDIYFQTGDAFWLTVAKRFEHASILTPLANNQDLLDGNHGNTNMPKFIGAAREYKATSNATYKAIATNAWRFIDTAHMYAIGGFTQNEAFRAPNAIASLLTSDTAEFCDSYNMLKLTRELFTINPSMTYADYYEQAAMNIVLGQQNPSDPHGHITYFNSLNPGGHRGVGPYWGGGTWSNDYDAFWCCQGTGIESHTKYVDSVYFYDNTPALWVNLFLPSVLNWMEKGVTITQATTFPASDTSTLTISGGSAAFSLKIRIPSWTSGASITVNGASAGVSVTPGSYATISRTWSSGDRIVVTLPTKFRLITANDNNQIAAVAYGPIVLVGNYGSQTFSSAPTINLNTLRRTSTTSLAFAATAGNTNVNLVPWYDGQGFNYVTYWSISGSVPSS